MKSFIDASPIHLVLAISFQLAFSCSIVAADDLTDKSQSRASIHMLVPGFTVHELPLELPNINNVRYRSDGSLYALGYNGNIWLLRDTNADGLEDKVELFFDGENRLRGPIGMAVIPRGHVLLDLPEPKSDAATPDSSIPQGVVVASKGKISAILDKDGDGVAEEERIIASGWQEIPPNVDAIGVAIDPEGAIYYGLGTAAYNNAYLIDEDGKAQYDLHSERGTILRIEPDLSKRSIVCTGVRFTIGMGFDNHGELFATDQEGATWLANGNPFDELLHIPTTAGATKRHFGFPPRHPKHLPRVIDEPSLFDYGPQHQSTCGMAFNLPRNFALAKDDSSAQPQASLFGPDDWRGNVFVTGESRGKLYRTELVRTERGQYIARNHLIACLGMLTVDCCISPRGDLVVACHSGGPDWGTGPTGTGKLFVIEYSDSNAPQPVAAWAAGPQEVRVAFDRPLDPARLRNLTGQTTITYGEFVAAGDRFETLKPGYAAVQRQMESARNSLPVDGVSVTSDRRTLVIATAPHLSTVQYAITLPPLERDQGKDKSTGTSSIQQASQIDLAYSLNGVLATWEPDDKTESSWSGVLPYLDFNVVNAFSSQDADSKRFQMILRRKGTLTLQTQLDLRNLVHPAVQPGSELAHEWPDEPVRVRLGIPGTQELSWTLGDKTETKTSSDGGLSAFTLELPSNGDTLTRISLSVRTGKRAEASEVESESVGWLRHDDNFGVRELPLNRFLLPWAQTVGSDTTSPSKREIPELANGSWGRGRQVFFSEDASCSKCHMPHALGGTIGPDLSNLVHRDYASVLRDVSLPSYTINPDYIASIVLLTDGRILTGTIRTDNNKLLVSGRDGKVDSVSQADVEELRHSAVSIMPEGMLQKLGPDRIRDLLTYLLTEPPHMPDDATLPLPKPRTRAEVARVLAGSQHSTIDAQPLRILLVAGAKDHGPGEHDYPAWLRVWSELLRGAEGVTVDTAMEWPTADQVASADTIVFYQKGTWNAARRYAIDAHLAKGRGLVYIHWAIEGGADAPEFAQRIGLASHSAKTQYRHGPLDISFQSLGPDSRKDHPISRNFDTVHFYDESYWGLQGDPTKLNTIATGNEGDQPRPLFWTVEPVANNAKQSGRVFVSIPGHYSWTFDDPLFRILLLRGIAWSMNEPVDRFNELATIGIKLPD